jgi:hypothetical protein
VMSRAGGARFGTTMTVVATLVVLTGVTALRPGLAYAQEVSARVGIQFLSDGRCEVSSDGEGFRSHATYMRAVGGARAELRCAMPPVARGQTIALTVSLPVGMKRPGSGIPPLEWVEVQGRWVGTAQLQEWPDAVVLSLGRGWTVMRIVRTAAAAIVVALMIVAIVTITRRGRAVTPPER